MSKRLNRRVQQYKTNPFTHNYNGMYFKHHELHNELKMFYKNSEMFIKYGNRFKIPNNKKWEVAKYLIEHFITDKYEVLDIRLTVFKMLRIF